VGVDDEATYPLLVRFVDDLWITSRIYSESMAFRSLREATIEAEWRFS